MLQRRAPGKKKAEKTKTSFPWKLYKLLDEAEFQGHDHVVSWLTGGKAFKVHKPDVFCSAIMINYFKQTKFKSFTRQVCTAISPPAEWLPAFCSQRFCC